MSFERKERYGIEDLLSIMELLRSDDGCPWDREQTHESIRRNLIEETYEVADAIDKRDSVSLREELGDLLLQIVFHARIEEECGRFGFDDVCDGICKKLVKRHPHIFSDTVAETSKQVLENWDAIKLEEKNQTSYTQTLQDVPAALPGLMRADKLQTRAAKSGFDYPDTAWAVKDMCSELDELREAVSSENYDAVEEEIGDLLFSVVNVSRFLDVDAENALQKSSVKFTRRFARVEQMALERGIEMKSAGIQLLDSLWKEAKQKNQ